MVVSTIFYFRPYLGKIPNLTIYNIFQVGWNHQLVLYSKTSVFFCSLRKVMAACRLGGAWPRAMNIFEVALNDGLVPEPKNLGKKTPPRNKRDRLVVSNIFWYFLFSSKWFNLTNIFQMGRSHQTNGKNEESKKGNQGTTKWVNFLRQAI